VAVVAKRASTYAAGHLRWRLLAAPFFVAAALAAIGLGATAAFADRALPRVTVAGVDVGTLQAPELRERLIQEAARPWAAAAVAVRGPDGLAWSTTNAALAIAPDVDHAVAEALTYGHTGSLPQRLAAWINALRGHAGVPFTMRADNAAAIDGWIGTIANAVDRPARDGAIVATYRGVDVTWAVVGRTTDRAALQRALLAPDTLGDRAIVLAIHEAYPAVDPSGCSSTRRAWPSG
jgi:hypothetical protein